MSLRNPKRGENNSSLMGWGMSVLFSFTPVRYSNTSFELSIVKLGSLGNSSLAIPKGIFLVKVSAKM